MHFLLVITKLLLHYFTTVLFWELWSLPASKFGTSKKRIRVVWHIVFVTEKDMSCRENLAEQRLSSQYRVYLTDIVFVVTEEDIMRKYTVTWKKVRKQSSFFLLDPLSKYWPHVSSRTQTRRRRSRCSGGSSGWEAEAANIAQKSLFAQVIMII